MTEDTERLTAACSYCGHRYTYPANIEAKAVMRCPQCREYIHVRTGAPLGQNTETVTSEPPRPAGPGAAPAVPAGIPEASSAMHEPVQAPATGDPAPARTHRPGSAPSTPAPALLALAGFLLAAIWILVSPDDRGTYVYDAKDGSFALCWPYIRWGIASLLALPCILAAIIVRTIKNAVSR